MVAQEFSVVGIMPMSRTQKDIYDPSVRKRRLKTGTEKRAD